MSDIRSFFREWCGLNNVIPRFKLKTAGPKHNKTYLSYVKVSSYDYVGTGNATNALDAQINAVKNFIHFLIRAKILSPDEIPRNDSNAEEPWDDSQDDSDEEDDCEYEDLGEGRINTHGNWNLSNSKTKLHQFLQMNKIKVDFNCSNRGYMHIAKMDVPVPHLDNKIISGIGESYSVKKAPKLCARDIVRQLYRAGVLEPYTGRFKKTIDAVLLPYKVALDPSLEEKLLGLMNRLGIKSVLDQEKTDEPVSLISSAILYKPEDEKPDPAGIVSWSIAEPNWHTWKGSQIGEGPLAEASMEEISSDLAADLNSRTQEDEKVMNFLREREKLPVFTVRDKIINAINEHPVVIVKGEAGCGKTTQVCQFILDSQIERKRGANCNVVVSLPRMLWAMMAAERVAAERGEELGISSGYCVRFDSCFPRPYGSIMFTTPGVLLRRMENGLKGVSHIIVDELQERDMNADFLLGVLWDMISLYPDMRVVLLTSSNHNTTKFTGYFKNSHVIDVPTESFPVELFFLEDCIEMLKFKPRYIRKRTKKDKGSEGKSGNQDNPNEDDNLNWTVGNEYHQSTRDALALLNEKDISFELLEVILSHCKSRGIQGSAVMVFLPSLHVIDVVLKRLKRNHNFSSNAYVICTLHHEFPLEEQKKVFEPAADGVMKIILTTDVAENCITINDVVFVIDVCKSKTKTIVLEDNMVDFGTRWASQQKLEQRKSRAGRGRPGFCFRLCSKARYERLESMDLNPPPEILRSNLHELALTVKLLKLGKIGQFFSKLIEPPPIEAVVRALDVLRELKCLDINDELTPLGRVLVRIPVDPKLGKMMVLGCIFKVGDAISTITASTSTFPEVYLNDEKLTGLQRVFGGGRCSDHAALMNLLESWLEIQKKGEEPEKQFVKLHQISLLALRTILQVKKRLREIMISVGFPEETVEPLTYKFDDDDQNLDVLAALLCVGLYPNISYHMDKRKILTSGSVPSLIHRTSVNCTRYHTGFSSPFIIFGEKRRSRLVVCQQTTKVTALHLLLFASNQVQLVDGRVRLDNWVNLRMKPEIAEAILALRPALDSLLMRICRDPSYIQKPSELDQEVIDVVKQLCLINTGRHNLDQFAMKRIKRPYDQVDKIKPAKMMKLNSGEVCPMGGGGHGRGFRGRSRFRFYQNNSKKILSKSDSRGRGRGGLTSDWRGGGRGGGGTNSNWSGGGSEGGSGSSYWRGGGNGRGVSNPNWRGGGNGGGGANYNWKGDESGGGGACIGGDMADVDMRGTDGGMEGGSRGFIRVGGMGGASGGFSRGGGTEGASGGFNRVEGLGGAGGGFSRDRGIGGPSGGFSRGEGMGGTSGSMRNTIEGMGGASGGFNRVGGMGTASGGFSRSGGTEGATGSFNRVEGIGGAGGGFSRDRGVGGTSGGFSRGGGLEGASGGMGSTSEGMGGATGGFNRVGGMGGASGGFSRVGSTEGASRGFNRVEGLEGAVGGFIRDRGIGSTSEGVGGTSGGFNRVGGMGGGSGGFSSDGGIGGTSGGFNRVGGMRGASGGFSRDEGTGGTSGGFSRGGGLKGQSGYMGGATGGFSKDGGMGGTSGGFSIGGSLRGASEGFSRSGGIDNTSGGGGIRGASGGMGGTSGGFSRSGGVGIGGASGGFSIGRSIMGGDSGGFSRNGGTEGANGGGGMGSASGGFRRSGDIEYSRGGIVGASGGFGIGGGMGGERGDFSRSGGGGLGGTSGGFSRVGSMGSASGGFSRSGGMEGSNGGGGMGGASRSFSKSGGIEETSGGGGIGDASGGFSIGGGMGGAGGGFRRSGGGSMGGASGDFSRSGGTEGASGGFRLGGGLGGGGLGISEGIGGGGLGISGGMGGTSGGFSKGGGGVGAGEAFKHWRGEGAPKASGPKPSGPKPPQNKPFKRGGSFRGRGRGGFSRGGGY